MGENIPRMWRYPLCSTIFPESTGPLAPLIIRWKAWVRFKQLDDEIYQAIHVKNIDLHDASAIA